MLTVDNSWTLFLDRDGVINERLPDAYVRHPKEFQFTEGCLDALCQLALIFPRIVVVTNQQGIGKGLMSEQDLAIVHQHMLREVIAHQGRIDAVYFCSKLTAENAPCRKPNPGMAHQAKTRFPNIDFEKSIMVGDSLSDMDFGEGLGMKTVFIAGKKEDQDLARKRKFDLRLNALKDLPSHLMHSV